MYKTRFPVKQWCKSNNPRLLLRIAENVVTLEELCMIGVSCCARIPTSIVPHRVLQAQLDAVQSSTLYKCGMPASQYWLSETSHDTSWAVSLNYKYLDYHVIQQRAITALCTLLDFGNLAEEMRNKDADESIWHDTGYHIDNTDLIFKQCEHIALWDSIHAAHAEKRRAESIVRKQEKVLQSNAIRDIICPWQLDQHSADLSMQVRDTVQMIIDGDRYDLLPILADIIEEQGYECEPVLDHLRSNGVHYNSCWALRHVRSLLK